MYPTVCSGQLTYLTKVSIVNETLIFKDSWDNRLFPKAIRISDRNVVACTKTDYGLCHMTKQCLSLAETLRLKESGTLDSPNVQKSQYSTEDSTAAGDEDSDLTTPDTKLRHPVK